MSSSNYFRLSLATVCLIALTGLAHAQWGWTDAAGNKQFSDQPPPSNIPEGKIFKRPYNNDPLLRGGPVYGTNAVPAKGTAQAAAAALAASAPASGASAPAAPKPGAAASKPKSADEQFKDRQEEKAKADAEAQKKAEVEAKNKAECERAKGYVKSLEDGVRIAKNDEKGNRALMDDKQRAAEAKRMREEIATRCK